MATSKEASRRPRQSNLELFRIILMLFIIAGHYVINSNIMASLQNDTVNANTIFLGGVSAFGKICINCFVLITGYFMCKSNITLKKFLKFVLEVMFYYTIIYILFCIFGVADFSAKEFFTRIIPIKSIGSDFTSAYIILFLCIPFINILVNNMKKYQHLSLLAILLFTYTILGNLPWVQVSFNYVSWFFVIYLIGSYIRIYPGKHSNNTRLWAYISFILFVTAILSVILSLIIRQSRNNFSIYYFTRDSNKILAVLCSISFFMLFKNLKIKYNHFINYIAASTFGVLLIHASGYIMTDWLWNKTLKTSLMYGNSLLPLHLLLSVLVVYATCVIIDKLRIKFIEEPLFKKISPFIEKTEIRIKNKINQCP